MSRDSLSLRLRAPLSPRLLPSAPDMRLTQNVPEKKTAPTLSMCICGERVVPCKAGFKIDD